LLLPGPALNVVHDRLEQTAFRPELVIHRRPGHVGPPGHLVDGQPRVAVLREQLSGHRDDPGAGLFDRLDPLAQPVATRAHLDRSPE
jgi:hypothetical protein